MGKTVEFEINDSLSFASFDNTYEVDPKLRRSDENKEVKICIFIMLSRKSKRVLRKNEIGRKVDQ